MHESIALDSLTQLVLGSSVAAACAPAGRLRRAIAYGAILGTLPDLDALLRFQNPVDSFVFHRSASHSLLVLTLLAPLIYLLLRRFDAALRSDAWRWLLAFWLVLITHPLLDFFTNYGTQLFWPISTQALGLGSIFIIDPAYTLPLCFVVIAGAVAGGLQRRLSWRKRTISALCVSQLYLGFTVFAQQQVRARVEAALASAGETINADQLAVFAAPFTCLVQRVIVREDGGFREAYVSFFADRKEPPIWQRVQSDDGLIAALTPMREFQRLRRFTDGFFKLSARADGAIMLTDIRMGGEPFYVFNFIIAQPLVDAALTPIAPEQVSGTRPQLSFASWIFRRIYTPSRVLPVPTQR